MTQKSCEDGLQCIRDAVSGNHEAGEALEQLVKLVGEAHRNSVTGAVDGRELENDLKMRRAEDFYENNQYFVVIDIDNFGRFNKVYGQDIGDLVLRTVEEVIKETVRENDSVETQEGKHYHLHGEEFVVTYECQNLEGAISAANRLRKAVEEQVVKRIEQTVKEITKKEIKKPVTISCGVTTYHPTVEQEELALRRADTYMQVAKTEGKNRVYCGEMDPLYEIKERLYEPGILDEAANLIAGTLRTAKGKIGSKITELYNKLSR